MTVIFTRAMVARTTVMRREGGIWMRPCAECDARTQESMRRNAEMNVQGASDATSVRSNPRARWWRNTASRALGCLQGGTP